jgi:hypothetical protein
MDTEGLTKALESALASALSDKAMEPFTKKVHTLASELEESLMWSLKDNLAGNLTSWVTDLAERAVTAMLEGNENEMRRYLSCEKRGPDGEYIGWTGRSDGQSNRLNKNWHPVIHGRLFEQGAVALRKKVAEANEALIRDERIIDLQDQIKSLVFQVNKANAEKEEMWQRLHDIS